MEDILFQNSQKFSSLFFSKFLSLIIKIYPLIKHSPLLPLKHSPLSSSQFYTLCVFSRILLFSVVKPYPKFSSSSFQTFSSFFFSILLCVFSRILLFSKKFLLLFSNILLFLNFPLLTLKNSPLLKKMILHTLLLINTPENQS